MIEISQFSSQQLIHLEDQHIITIYDLIICILYIYIYIYIYIYVVLTKGKGVYVWDGKENVISIFVCVFSS